MRKDPVIVHLGGRRCLISAAVKGDENKFEGIVRFIPSDEPLLTREAVESYEGPVLAILKFSDRRSVKTLLEILGKMAETTWTWTVVRSYMKNTDDESKMSP